MGGDQDPHLQEVLSKPGLQRKSTPTPGAPCPAKQNYSAAAGQPEFPELKATAFLQAAGQ